MKISYIYIDVNYISAGNFLVLLVKPGIISVHLDLSFRVVKTLYPKKIGLSDLFFFY